MLDAEVLGNPLPAWLTALGIALAINVVVGLVKWLVVNRLATFVSRSSTSWR